MTKVEAGRIGHSRLRAKLGDDAYHREQSERGRSGGNRTWERYKLVPVGTAEFAMVNRTTGVTVCIRKG